MLKSNWDNQGLCPPCKQFPSISLLCVLSALDLLPSSRFRKCSPPAASLISFSVCKVGSIVTPRGRRERREVQIKTDCLIWSLYWLFSSVHLNFLLVLYSKCSTDSQVRISLCVWRIHFPCLTCRLCCPECVWIRVTEWECATQAGLTWWPVLRDSMCACRQR